MHTHTHTHTHTNSLVVKKLSWKLEPPHATNNKTAPLTSNSGFVPASPFSPLPSPLSPCVYVKYLVFSKEKTKS